MTAGTCLLGRYLHVRRATERLCEPLAVEGYVAQAMPDASYRNFFPPDARRQFSGVRLARDS